MMLPPCHFLAPGFYPEIKDVVQINVRQEWRNHGTLRRSHLRLGPLAVFRHSGLQPFLDQAKHTAIGHAMLDELRDPFVGNIVEESTNVCIEHPIHSLPMDTHTQRIERLVRAATGTEPVRKALKVHLMNLVEN